ncbi:head maturation protease, ClpP-related [Psychrobacillus sp.]|uniref:head maturation protease, ClpP-related n=1 Tax=Psychrobacillus sp. TaxID=1871623 RepID=UPI0028BE995E|nr:head maturation protease, ClpP-related [Psychrobacillus sp.]
MVKKIKIKGTIISNDVQWIYDLFDIEATSPNVVADALESAGNEDVEVIINSGGGDVFAGSEIYTELKSYAGNVTTKVVGIAASAASVIAMAGKKVQISPTAQIMIHNVSSRAAGDYRDLQHEADVLKNYNKSIANAYMIKSGMKEEELLELMNKETWFNAQQALENKLADEIMFEDQLQFSASIGNSPMLPQQVIDTIRNMKDKFSPVASIEESKSDILMEQKTKLNLLKLKGDVKS